MCKFYLIYGLAGSCKNLQKQESGKSANVLRKSGNEKFETESRIFGEPFADMSETFVLSWSHYFFLMDIDNTQSGDSMR